MDFDVVSKFLSEKGQPSFRLKQIKDAYFQQFVTGFDQISNLPESLRQDLSKNFLWLLVKPVKKQGGFDQEVIKELLELEGGQNIESVLMIYRDWISACVSVMVGCPLGCGFCATGQMGFKRNLTAFEIVDQIVFWNQYLEGSINDAKIMSLPVKGGNKGEFKNVTNIVFMGMGEPFLNWDSVWQAIQIINAKDGLNIGQRHISISTAGIVPGIIKFADLDTQINLAISLHSPFQNKREEIMPVAKQYSLSELMQAAKYYVDKTNRKLFFEYALIDGFNDRPEDAAELKKLFTSHLFHLNLINLNPTKAKLSPPEEKRIKAFTELLEKYHLSYTLRRSVGREIQAACGQLAGN